MLRMVDSFSHRCECVPSRSQCFGIIAKVMYNKILSKGAQVHVKALRLKRVHGPREELDDHHLMIIGINH